MHHLLIRIVKLYFTAPKKRIFIPLAYRKKNRRPEKKKEAKNKNKNYAFTSHYKFEIRKEEHEEFTTFKNNDY